MKRLSAHGSNHHLNGSPGKVYCFFTSYPRSQFRCGTDDLNGDLSRHGTHFWLLVLMEFVNTIYLEACQRISSKLHYCFNLQINDIFRISHLLSVKWIRNVRIYICFTINNFNQDTFFSSQNYTATITVTSGGPMLAPWTLLSGIRDCFLESGQNDCAYVSRSNIIRW